VVFHRPQQAADGGLVRLAVDVRVAPGPAAQHPLRHLADEVAEAGEVGEGEEVRAAEDGVHRDVRPQVEPLVDGRDLDQVGEELVREQAGGVVAAPHGDGDGGVELPLLAHEPLVPGDARLRGGAAGEEGDPAGGGGGGEDGEHAGGGV